MEVPPPSGAVPALSGRPHRTLVVSVVFVLYLVMGSLVFHCLETYSRPVTATSEGSRPVSPERLSETGQHLSEDTLEWLCRRSAAGQAGRLLPAELSGTGWQLRQLLCGSGSDRPQSQQPEPAWSFIDALFFCLTVVTTIGYGQLSPRTAGGQLFCLLYALVGIPISGLLLAGLSDLLAGHLLSFYHTTWAKRHGRSKWSLAALTVLYLLFGLLLFVLVPAVAFSWLENWNYREAVYYAFVTLSTIGFGDYTAAGPGPSDTAWSTVYKLLLMLWILLGLGYWVLVLDFLQRTLKSKEVLQALQGTSRLMGREAAELRAALTELGVLRPDAAFVPQHSKAALSLVLGVSRSLAGAAPPAHTTAGLPGIHAIGDGLLSALLSALPASPSDSPQAASGGAVNEGCRPADGSQRQRPPGPQ